jgi:L-alanine-DL-glutamate epimerase-like enolase superfamily enzyme
MELDYTYNPLRAELLLKALEVRNGFMVAPEKPGLGVELNAEALRKFAFAGPEEMAVRKSALR